VCLRAYVYKSSAAAEMGDRDHNGHGPKRGGGLLCPFRGRAGSLSNTMWHGQSATSLPSGVFMGRALLPYQVASSSIQPFGHNRHEPKTGGCAPFRGSCGAVPLFGGAATSCNTTSPGPSFTSVVGTKWHLDPSSRLATIDMGQTLAAAVPFFWGGQLGSHPTQSHLGRGQPPY